MEKDKDQAAVSQDALEKALTQLNDMAKSQKDEKQDLLQKAVTADLSADENKRLIELMSGGKNETETLAKSATSALQPANSPAVQAAVDVSEYLNAFHTGTLTSIETMADTIEKSSTQQHEFNVVLAKAVVQLATLVKSMDSRLENWGSEAVENPKAVRTQAQAQQAKPMQKSFAGQTAPAADDQISKGEILNLLEEMHVDSLKKGRGGQANCGEDLMKSIAKYEQTAMMSRPLVEEMKSFRNRSRS